MVHVFLEPNLTVVGKKTKRFLQYSAVLSRYLLTYLCTFQIKKYDFVIVFWFNFYNLENNVFFKTFALTMVGEIWKNVRVVVHIWRNHAFLSAAKDYLAANEVLGTFPKHAEDTVCGSTRRFERATNRFDKKRSSSSCRWVWPFGKNLGIIC